jgi:hypothetical protein
MEDGWRGPLALGRPERPLPLRPERQREGAGVTEPPKIILYYHLSLSMWPLSNNKELLSLLSGKAR